MRKLMFEGKDTELNSKLLPLIDWLFQEPNPIALNTALAQLGVVRPVFRLPYVPLPLAKRVEFVNLVKKIGRENFVGEKDVQVLDDDDFILIESTKIIKRSMGHQSSSSEPPSLENEKGEAIAGSYSAWLTKHPSALDAFERMMRSAEGKNLVVFLDYDGTLSPIVNEPDQAFMSEKMRSAVQKVADVFPTAIVSGRSLDKVKGFVQLQNVTYDGSHGMDILTPTRSLKCDQKHQNKAIDKEGNDVICFQPAKDFLPKIQEILKVLEEKIKIIDGASVEDNKFCLSVHFRRVNIKEVDILKMMVEPIVEGYPDFRITNGKKVMEIRPRIDWDKGRALQYLVEYLGIDDSQDYLPLHIGDDKTDEDAFQVIKDIGRGYPIIVSSIPKETKALYSLHDTDEVMSFLMKLAEWKNSTSGSSN